MSDANNDLLIRLAALEKENAALRGQAAPAPQTEEPQPEEKPSRLDALLGGLIRQTKTLAEQANDLSLPNDPNGDQIAQTAGRTQILCRTVVGLTKVIVSLTKAVGTGFGASGAMLVAISRDVESMRTSAGTSAPTVPMEAAEQPGTIEVDDTGAPEQPIPPPAVATPRSANGKRGKPVAAAPAGPPVGPPSSTPTGMPAEVANLPQGMPAAIASVTVK